MFGWNETHGYVDLMKHRLDYGSRDAYRPADGVEKYGMYCSMNGIKHAHDIAARQKNYAETMVNYFTHLAEVGATQLQHDSERDAYMYMTNYGRNVPQGCILM
jgi:hypothetical protein